VGGGLGNNNGIIVDELGLRLAWWELLYSKRDVSANNNNKFMILR